MNMKGIEKLIKHVEDYVYVESDDYGIEYTTLDDISYSDSVHITIGGNNENNII